MRLINSDETFCATVQNTRKCLTTSCTAKSYPYHVNTRTVRNYIIWRYQTNLLLVTTADRYWTFK